MNVMNQYIECWEYSVMTIVKIFRMLSRTEDVQESRSRLVRKNKQTSQSFSCTIVKMVECCLECSSNSQCLVPVGSRHNFSDAS